jgi:hypothetical protein
LTRFFAGAGTGVAAVHLLAIRRVGDGFCVDGGDLGRIPLAILEIANDHVAFEVLADDPRAGAEVMRVVVHILHRLDDPLRRGRQRRHVGDGHLERAAHGDCLEVLGAHDGAGR